MLRQQQHDAGATSILGQQFNGVSQFKDLFQRVLFALLATCIARQQEQAKMAGLGVK